MKALAQALMPHLMVAPVLLPLLAACLLMLVSERRHRTKATLGLLATTANLVVAVLLVFWVKAEDEPSAFGISLPSNWDVPYGIALVLDRLSALMLVMTALVALMALLFSLARWHKAGAHFHPLFQIQIMGLNGAFLTGDLFNLFVFFEVMLAASYGLLLHGSGPARVKAGLHYIAINLAASSLFLVGAALIYGISGTLNMADLAARLPEVADADRALLHAGCAILGVAFLAKAAMWPLNFWLVPAYASASAPSAAVFALLTKVGVYVLLRLSTLLFLDDAGESAGFGSAWLLWGGLATLTLGAIGMMSAQRPARLAGFAVVISSGTLMAVFGLARPEVTAGALYYLPVSTLAVAAFFLLTELMDRSRQSEGMREQAPEDEEDHLPFSMAELELAQGTNLDEDEVPLVGRAIPAATALLGLAFICCTLLGAPGGSVAPVSWLLMGAIITSGLLALLALFRTGMRFFWAPVLRVVEYLPIALLIALCVLFTVRAEAVMRYTTATAAALYQPRLSIDAIMSARPLPTPTNADRLGVPMPGGVP